MRPYSEILKEIEKTMIDNGLTEDLNSLQNWQKGFPEEQDFCSATATWLYTFHIYTPIYNEALNNLIDEFAFYCKSQGIPFG